MKKQKNTGAQEGKAIVNRATDQKLKGSIRIMLLLDDNTIEDTSRIELDQMLSEFGYNK